MEFIHKDPLGYSGESSLKPTKHVFFLRKPKLQVLQDTISIEFYVSRSTCILVFFFIWEVGNFGCLDDIII